LPQLAAVDRLAARPNAIERSPAALMMSIDIQIAICLAVSNSGRARSLGCYALHPSGLAGGAREARSLGLRSASSSS